MADSRLQVDLDQDTLTVLDSLMVEVRRSESNRKIGAGTIAARLLQSLTSHPELIKQLLTEYAHRSGTALATAEPHAEYETEKHPKSSAGRRR